MGEDFKTKAARKALEQEAAEVPDTRHLGEQVMAHYLKIARGVAPGYDDAKKEPEAPKPLRGKVRRKKS